MSRTHMELPHVTRVAANCWSVQWAGCAAFTCDDRTFTTLVRGLPRHAQQQLFERLSNTLSRRRPARRPGDTDVHQLKQKEN